MTILDQFFTDPTERDFFRMFCGEKLGAGISREVWSFGLDDKFVIKFEIPGSFQNVAEWQLWQDAQHMKPEIRDWIAPCDRISNNGRVLIMHRTTPAKKFPERLPVWLGDCKRTNYGMLRGKFVCHDYGTNMMCNSGLTKRTYKVNWWDA